MTAWTAGSALQADAMGKERVPELAFIEAREGSAHVGIERTGRIVSVSAKLCGWHGVLHATAMRTGRTQGNV